MLAADSAATLQTAFGFAGFREGQREVIDRLLAGRSTLAIFPTGSGKSLCYQLPALLLDGVTVVISPLIALMKDQVQALRGRGIAAARIDSSLDYEEARGVLSAWHAGKLKLLYLSPERFTSERMQIDLKRQRPALLAVDESHCISEWGHNFRPDYLKIGKAAAELGIARVLALTATATPAVARDIAHGFHIAESDIVRTGFYRPNLHLVVTPCTPGERLGLLRDRLTQPPHGATIVYVTLQRTAEEVAEAMAKHGLPAKAYHAGMEPEARTAVQDWFMAKPDAIVVATIAFGMGIDKADIRRVIHFNLPKSLENYAQEIGRSGRDGQPAHCELLACAEDRVTLENFIYGDTPTQEAVGSLVGFLQKQPETFDVSTYDLSKNYDIKPLVIETLLTYLEVDGELAATGEFYSTYRLRSELSIEQIAALFPGERGVFLQSLFRQSRPGRTWDTLDVADAAQAIGQPRARIIAALNYLEEEGHLTIKPAGTRAGYRRLRPPANRAAQTASLYGRVAERERRDVERLEKVIRFVHCASCLTQYLLQYFGDRRPRDCGHCSNCEGRQPRATAAAAPQALGGGERQMVLTLRRMGGAALSNPRQIACFLCGMTTPAMYRSGVTRHDLFGKLQHVPFQEVLKLVEDVASDPL